jgi:hypothetical protein
MAVVSTMILRSMRMIGEKARGATLDSNEQAECLAEFQTFLDSCATEPLLCYQITQDSVALSASTSTLTIGANGAFAVARPLKLVDPCFVRDSSGFDTPLTIVNIEAYGRIVDKDAGFTVPNVISYDAGFSATSTGTLRLYPSPSAGLTLFINSWKQLLTVSTVSHNVALPPGYQLFLESNFAIHLAAGLTPVPPETLKIARDSKASVKGVNLPEPVMTLDAGAVGRGRGGNIFTG